VYYTNPKHHGYLADQKEEFFKERGFDPASAFHRPASAKAAGRASDSASGTVETARRSSDETIAIPSRSSTHA